MLLAIDIGNTNISFAIFKEKKLKKQFDIPSNTYSKSGLLKKLGDRVRIFDTVICSVVPKLTAILKRDLESLTGKKVYIIGKDLNIPLRNRYLKPSQLGQDRLVNAYAAYRLYKAPLIVIDSGTAVTFDVVGSNRAYLGGLIIPGMKITLESLKEKTALLPLVKLGAPKVLIGRSTKESILSGVVFGIAGMVKELANRIKKDIGKNAVVIGTGGNINLIKKYSGLRLKIEPELTLKGIKFIHESKI